MIGKLHFHWPKFDTQSVAALMAVAVLVGLGTGLTAGVFIKAIAWVHSLFFPASGPAFFNSSSLIWGAIVVVIGSLLTGPMIARWAIEAKGHGVPEVMQAIILRNGRIRPRVALVKSVTSAICIGTGGSAGREGPIVQVGAALGSTAAQLMRFNSERTITLVACGAAAGIAATFNAPIAGVIFAMEVILGEFSTHYFSMVVVAAVAASVVSRRFLGANPAFTIPAYALVSPWELLFYILLGVLAAATAWLFVQLLYYLEDVFDDWHFPMAFKPAVGAIGVGLVGLFFPQALGSGLPTIELGLNGSLPWVLLFMLIFAKLLSTSFTLGSGNSGGIFSPALYMGAMLGGVFGYWVHVMFPDITATSGAYALVGMAAVFSAAAHAPLTAFLIVFEMSGDYRIILPLMITVGLSTVLSQAMRRYSIYTLKLMKKGIPLERDRDVDVMKGIMVNEVMSTTPDIIPAEMPLDELANVFMQTHHHGFPVVDKEQHLVGVVTVQDLEINIDKENGKRTVADITTHNPATVFPDEPISKALRLMSEHDFGRVPVVSRQDPQQLVGLLRRGDMIRAYRQAILRKLEQQHRSQNVRLGRLTDSEIVEVTLTRDTATVGMPVRSLRLPNHALITSIRRRSDIIIPHGDTLLEPGDQVTLLARTGTALLVKRALTEKPI